MRFVAMVAVLALLVTACASEVSLTDYAEEVERLVVAMNERLDDGEPALDAGSTLARAQAYLADRADARNEFLDAFGALSPPEDAAELHAAALDIVTRLAAAEAALADLALQATTFEDASAIWNTPQGEAFQSLDEEALALCLAAQTDFDATADRDAFSETPWIPPEMKEVVEVAFRCDRAER